MKIYLQKIWAMVLVFSMLNLTCVRPVAAFSVGEEREVGEALLYQVRLAFTLLDDPDISQYINDLGAEVLEVAGVQYFNYHFLKMRRSGFEPESSAWKADILPLNYDDYPLRTNSFAPSESWYRYFSHAFVSDPSERNTNRLVCTVIGSGLRNKGIPASSGVRSPFRLLHA